MRSSVSVREANTNDAPSICTNVRRTFALACPPNTSKRKIDMYLDRHFPVARVEALIASSDVHVLVVDAGAAIAGCALLRVYRERRKGPQTAELSRLYVLPQHHRLGIGSALLHAAIDRAVAEQCLCMHLSVSQENSRAIKFYHHHQFAVVGVATFTLIDERHRDCVMSRTLRGTRHLTP